MNKLVLIGPPGAGKGTQAKMLSIKYQIPHISTGDILRENINRNTDLGRRAELFIERGQLVPDVLVLEIVLDRLHFEDCKAGYILDGFPRNLSQALELNKILSSEGEQLSAAILIDADRDSIIRRITGRRQCESCGAIYHIEEPSAEKAGICDKCGSEIIQRKDDHEKIVKKRLEVYEEQTQPLITYYDKLNILHRIDGHGGIDQIFNEICGLLQ